MICIQGIFGSVATHTHTWVFMCNSMQESPRKAAKTGEGSRRRHGNSRKTAPTEVEEDESEAEENNSSGNPGSES